LGLEGAKDPNAEEDVVAKRKALFANIKKSLNEDEEAK
jgi:hypothetical protein